MKLGDLLGTLSVGLSAHYVEPQINIGKINLIKYAVADSYKTFVGGVTNIIKNIRDEHAKKNKLKHFEQTRKRHLSTISNAIRTQLDGFESFAGVKENFIVAVIISAFIAIAAVCILNKLGIARLASKFGVTIKDKWHK